jgi:hypothetical protein
MRQRRRYKADTIDVAAGPEDLIGTGLAMPQAGGLYAPGVGGQV